jgi:ABC-2 type transport system permease protein
MRSLLTLTVANIRSFTRDRAAMFWTLAFPLVFIVLFGTIFSSSGADLNYKIGWVDQDGSQASATLHETFKGVPAFTLLDQPSLDAALETFRRGDVRAVIVVPKDYARAVAAAQTGVPNGGVAGASVNLTLYTDPSQQTTTGVISGIVNAVVARVNQGDRPAPIGVEPKAIQAQNISVAAFFVPSILAMALMQLGLFGAIPLVQQREKLILKRLNATPLRRWTLIGSNVLTRLLIGLVQTLLIVGVGARLFDVTIVGSPLVVAFLVVLGALMFISLGYVVASFVPTEESANMVTSILQFPLMFLSGIFFPLEQMPDWLRTVAAALPLTYLGDALRQVMVGGTPFVPVALSVGVLAAWLLVCFGVSARFFRWQ